MKTKRITSLVLTATIAQGTMVNALPNKIDNLNVDNQKNNKPYKTGEFVNGIEINKMLIDINYSKGVIRNPQYIVIHDTDNRDYGAGAIANRNYFANHPSSQASAHYIVDDKNIVQALEDNWRGWHIGDKYPGVTPNRPEATNSNTIAIEIAVNPDSNFDISMKNGIELTKKLMQKYDIPAENVITHNDATGKICPRMMIKDKPYLWDNFKKSVGASSGESGNTNPSPGGSSGIYSEIKNVDATVNYAGKLTVSREKNVSSNSVGVVYNKESVRLNYVDEEWANITFNSSEGGKRTGFIKEDNLNIQGVTKFNKSVKISGLTSTVSVYKDLNSNYQDTLDNSTNVTLNYTFNDWANISYTTAKGNRNGFINKQLINMDGSNTTDIDTSNKDKMAKVVNANSVNVRQQSNTNSEILGVMYKNEQVRINFSQGEWTNVTFKNTSNQEKIGFMKSEYLSVINSNDGNEKPVLTGKGQVVNVTTNLRMRKGPGTSYDVVTLLYPNNKFDILGKEDNWYKISSNGQSGYIHKDYVEIITGSNNDDNNSTSNGENSISSKGKVTNVTSTLRMRSGSGTNFSVVDTLNANSVFDIIGKENGWYKIKFNEKIGYVHGDYVQEIKGPISGGNNENNNNVSNEGKKYGEIVNAPSGLRVREGAGTNYNVVTMLNNGQKVEINGREGSWVKISVNGKNGYVHSDYIKEIGGNTNDGSNPGDNNGSTEETTSKKGKVVNISSTLRIREDAGTSFNTVGYINNGEEFDIVGKKNGWYKIKYKDKTGYVHGDYVQEINDNNNNNNNNSNGGNNSGEEIIINKKGKVVNVTSSLRVRSSADASSSVVGYLTPNATFDILSKNGSWYKIKFDTYDVKKEGYVHSDYVEEYHEASNNNQLGKQVVEYAKKFLGIPYVWGGTTTSGFDCSGLTQYVFNNFGIKIGRTTWDQIKSGKRIDMSAIKEGDLIFFGSYSDPNNSTHVGIYIGNDEFIHAPKPGEVVKISKLSTYGMNKIQANRVIN